MSKSRIIGSKTENCPSEKKMLEKCHEYLTVCFKKVKKSGSETNFSFAKMGQKHKKLLTGALSFQGEIKKKARNPPNWLVSHDDCPITNLPKFSTDWSPTEGGVPSDAEKVVARYP